MTRRIRGFDGLRAIAFLLVFVSHKTGIAHNARYGDIGVWLFFALSGFLITRILADAREAIELGTTRLPAALTRFYVRRTARIFPVYYAVLAVFSVAAWWVRVDDFGWKERLAYWFYATNILVEYRQQWVGDFGHFWSLAIEEQFYLLFAPIVLLASRAHTRTVCLAFVLAGLMTKAALELRGANPISIDVDSFVNFTILAWGGLVGLSAGREAPRPLVGAGAQLAILMVYVALPTIAGSHMEGWGLFGKLSALLAGVLLFQIYREQDSAMVSLLESAPLRGLGRISYGAYLFHPFIHGDAAETWLRRFDLPDKIPQAFQLSLELAATIVLANLSWHFVEQPIRNWATQERIPTAEKAASPNREATR